MGKPGGLPWLLAVVRDVIESDLADREAFRMFYESFPKFGIVPFRDEKRMDADGEIDEGVFFRDVPAPLPKVFAVGRNKETADAGGLSLIYHVVQIAVDNFVSQMGVDVKHRKILSRPGCGNVFGLSLTALL